MSTFLFDELGGGTAETPHGKVDAGANVSKGTIMCGWSRGTQLPGLANIFLILVWSL